MRPTPFWLSFVLLRFAFSAFGRPVPPAEELLPSDTLFYLTIPDANRSSQTWSSQAPARLWADPVMRPFRDHFEGQIRTRILRPFEELTQFGWTDLLKKTPAQITFAVLPSDATNTPNRDLSFLLLLDCGDKGPEVAEKIAALRNDPNASTNATSVTIEEVEFTRISVPEEQWCTFLDTAFPRPAGGPPPAPRPPSPIHLYLAQTGSVFLATTRTNGVGALVERCSSEPPQEPRRTLFATRTPPAPDVVLRGAVNVPAVAKRVRSATPVRGKSGGLPSAARLVDALGVLQWEALSFDVQSTTGGWHLDWHLDVPPQARTGLLKLFQLLPGDALPPSFIGADAVQFSRTRISASTSWEALQKILRDIEPNWLAVLQLFTGYAGRTEDADFDFEKGFIGRLGDDWVYASFPANTTPPSMDGLTAIGSEHPGELLHAVKLVAAPTYLATFLPPDAPAPIRENKQILGHNVIRLDLPALPWPWQEGATGLVYFATNPAYLGVTGTEEVMTRFLASTAGPSLQQRPEFIEAMKALNPGTATGHLSFRDERDAMGRLLASSPSLPDVFEDFLRWAALSETATRVTSALVATIDLERLPPYDRISRYFGIRLRSANATPAGYKVRIFRSSPGQPGG